MKFSESKIYRLVCNCGCKQQYIGSTTTPLSKRYYAHKNHWKRYQEGKVHYVKANDIIDHGNSDIILLESFPCANSDELHARERFWIENTPCINLNMPSRTGNEHYHQFKEVYSSKRKEYRELHHDRIRKREKERYEQNKNAISERRKQPMTCECGSVVTRCNILAHRKTQRHLLLLTIRDEDKGEQKYQP